MATEGQTTASVGAPPRKVYVEPTNRCNLDCRTCMRNIWNETLGHMSRTTFDRIIDGLRAFSLSPTVFFGGLGEPLTHPDITEMVAQAKSLGARVELITNATLLDKAMGEQLLDAGLDLLWFSLDGATPDSYEDVRLGAALPEVLANLSIYRDSCVWFSYKKGRDLPFKDRRGMGMVFVAMKRNVNELPAMLRLGSQLGIARLMVTNVLPYTQEMCQETLYSRSLTDRYPLISLEMPGIDIDAVTAPALYAAARSGYSITFRGGGLSEGHDRCPFMTAGAVAISWDGGVSPCLPLMHTHTRFVDGREQLAHRYVIDRIEERGLDEIWYSEEYRRFRDRVERFDFSPCTICGGCDLSEENQADCSGNSFPTCGLCPWAQGVVQCP